MIGVHGAKLARIDPRLNDRCLFVDQLFYMAVQRFAHAGRALHDLDREQPAFARHGAAHFQLTTDVGQDFFDGIALGIHLTQGRCPAVD